MTNYEKLRIKEADYCDCGDVRGSHAGKHFGLRLGLMVVIIGTMLPFSYLGTIGVVSETTSSILWAMVMGIGLFLTFKVIDQGCSFCTCNKFKWSGKNKYD